MSPAEDEGLESLLTHIRTERGFDFTGYKRASLARRVQRRMSALQVDSVEDYLDQLVVRPDEFTALFNTILINVTSFFRDPDVWDHLREQLLPPLLAAREGRPIRAWSAGCATGEEAYTLAICLAERLGLEEFRSRVKIYATDVDEEALDHARAATYSAIQLDGLPEDLRTKYFEPAGTSYAVRKELRRAVIFGRNDLVQDAPISHIDVLSCRNTMMYFTPETQSRILQRFHFALRPEGVLVLGKAEMLLGHAATFEPIELKRRLFRKTVASDTRSLLTAVMPGPVRPAGDETPLRQAAWMASGPAQIVVDGDGRLALCNNRAMSAFGLTERDLGRPIQDLDVSYRPVELRAVLDDITADRRMVWLRDVTLVRGTAEPVQLDVQLIALADEAGRDLGVTVLFHDVTEHRQLQAQLEYTNRQLETAYEELQSTNEELETTNEELQSTVEELETTNEELQSTNEELETMNEELQSMNDELQSGNDALTVGQLAVERLNRFMTSVLSSLNAGVAVVDSELRVLAWNSVSEDLWGVRTDEAVGALLTDLDVGLPLGPVVPEVRDHFEHDGEATTVDVDAVNRRGRKIAVRVTMSRVKDLGDVTPAVMLVMDAVPGAGSAPGRS